MGRWSNGQCDPPESNRPHRQIPTSNFRDLETPELEAFALNRFFDRLTGQPVRRRRFGGDDTGYGPGSVVFRQLAPCRVARKSAQVLGDLGFEDIETHVLLP